MKFLIQVIENASIKIDGTVQNIGKGLLIYVGISVEDQLFFKQKNNEFSKSIGNLKIISNGEKIEQSLQDINGEILLVSNFTLYGENKKGKSIDFSNSAKFQDAKNIYEDLVKTLKNNGYKITTGIFGAKMEITSKNIGPLNYILEI